MKNPLLPILLPLALLAAPLFAVNIEEEELDELHHMGEELREELEILQNERGEIAHILKELQEGLEHAGEREHRRDLEREIQHLRAEAKTFQRLIPMLQRVLESQKAALKALEGEDEDAFWRKFQQVHRMNDGFRLRHEIVYLEQEKAIRQTEFKAIREQGDKEGARWVMLELELAERNLAAQYKLLHQWEELEVRWKADPEADTEEQEEAFWSALEANELARQKQEIQHSMEILKLEARELEQQQVRLKKRHSELKAQVAEHEKIQALYQQLQEARAEGDEIKLEELEEAYHSQREAYHIKQEIRHVAEELEFLREEGEEEEARDVAGHLEELKEELESLR